MEDGQHYLFSYFEYTGTDFAKDMAKMAADPATQRWWTFSEPCQKPLAGRKEGLVGFDGRGLSPGLISRERPAVGGAKSYGTATAR